MQGFRELNVWQKSHQLTLEVYKTTTQFPADERYGLSKQMRRSATSIPTNIAEGCVRGSDADFARFLYIALGSASELEYQLLLTRDLAMIDAPVYKALDNQTIQVKRMLSALIKTLKADG